MTRAFRIGFVPLIDAAPLIVASELGYFADERVRVELHRQIGWANIRDKLLFGHLDAAHALLGMPVRAAISRSRPGMVGVMSLGIGGDAITLSNALVDAGVDSAVALRKYIRLLRRESPILLGHVFADSVHHYLLRHWLASAGIDPDTDVRLAVVPPPQTADHLAAGHLDGFCVGEPWNTLAQIAGVGRIVTLTTDILNAHPDKVLAVRPDLIEIDPDLLTRIIRAVLRGCAFCANPANRFTLARILAQPQYLNVDAGAILSSLSINRKTGLRREVIESRPLDWQMRSFARRHTDPSESHARWLLEQMIRWKHVEPSTGPACTVGHALDRRCYDAAIGSLDADSPCPSSPENPETQSHEVVV